MSRKQVTVAKLNSIRRVALSGIGTGQYDDNLIRMNFRITEGPSSIVGRSVTASVSIDDFVKNLPPEVACGLRAALNESVLYPDVCDVCGGPHQDGQCSPNHRGT